MRLRSPPQNGQRLRPTRHPFAVRNVGHPQLMPKLFGSIGDRPFLPSTISANGRSFTNAPAAGLGGPGATIAPPMTSNSPTIPPTRQNFPVETTISSESECIERLSSFRVPTVSLGIPTGGSTPNAAKGSQLKPQNSELKPQT